MIFPELASLPFDSATGKIDLAALRVALPKTPGPVAQQLYVDHGRNSDFQTMYAQLRIDEIEWALVSMTAAKLVESSMNPSFRRWFETVAKRAAEVESGSWGCVDGRANVADHWKRHLTWMMPPVLLDGKLMSLGSELHLVEGHTRVGLLAGLLHNKVLPGTSEHQVWLGTSPSA